MIIVRNVFTDREHVAYDKDKPLEPVPYDFLLSGNRQHMFAGFTTFTDLIKVRTTEQGFIKLTLTNIQEVQDVEFVCEMFTSNGLPAKELKHGQPVYLMNYPEGLRFTRFEEFAIFRIGVKVPLSSSHGGQLSFKLKLEMEEPKEENYDD